MCHCFVTHHKLPMDIDYLIQHVSLAHMFAHFQTYSGVQETDVQPIDKKVACLVHFVFMLTEYLRLDNL